MVRDPISKKPLLVVPYSEGTVLQEAGGGAEYRVVDGIARMLDNFEICGPNKKYQSFYDKIAWLVDLVTRVAMWWGGRFSLEELPFKKHLEDLKIAAGDNVLEVSVGAGHKVLALPETAEYYGVDISLGMLRRCRKAMTRYGRKIQLFHAMAESLPFEDCSFDVVYHIGGINFFSDKKKAVEEMLRVAKPGARLLISDETEQGAMAMERLPIIGKWAMGGRTEAIVSPINLIPQDLNPRLDFVDDGDFYVISFAKPFGSFPRQG